MTARFASHNSVSSCTAYGCASVRIRPILDAAVILVVSICAVIVRVIGSLA